MYVQEGRGCTGEPSNQVVYYLCMYRKVGGALESRVIKWFDYLWSNKNSMDEEMVLNMLPEKLKVQTS